MNSKTAIIILGACVALSIATNLPYAWLYQWHIDDNGTICSAKNIKFFSENGKFLFYFRLVVEFIIPMLILVVTSILTIKKVLTYPFSISRIVYQKKNNNYPFVTDKENQ